MAGPSTLPSWAGRGGNSASSAPPSWAGGSIANLPTFTGKGGAPAAQSHHGSFFGNLANDVETTAANIVPGIVGTVEHPIRAAEQIGHQYGQYYSPLVHGDLGKFWQNVHAHPLQLGLDALTVATLGAGAAAKAGLLSSEAVPLTVPDIAKQAGQEGEDVVIRKSSTNPLVRARQTTINKALNNARPDLPVVGSQARFSRVLSREGKVGLTQKVKGVPFEQAFARLNKAEKVTWHLKMQQLHPDDYAHLLHEEAVKNPFGSEAAMEKVVSDPKVNALFAKPTKRLQDALVKGRQLSDEMTATKTERGMLEGSHAEARAFLPARIASGAKLNAEGEWEGGKSIAELKADLAAKGEEMPRYVPHSAETGQLPSRAYRPTGYNAPMKMGSESRNEGTLLQRGMIDPYHDALSAENSKLARFVGRSDVHAALIEHAAQEPLSGLPKGYTYLKDFAGQRNSTFTERQLPHVLEALHTPEEQSLYDKLFTHNSADAGILHDGEGRRLIVPESVAEHLAAPIAPTRGLVSKLLYNKPTTVWKHLVLGLRPAYFANIVLSQHILGALQAAPGLDGITAYLNHVVPGARLGKLTDATVEKVMPDQAHWAFSSSEGFTSNKGLATASKVYQGVMPATLKVENWLRRLMIEGWAKSEPEVQAALRRNGGDINKALEEVAKTDPHVVDEISRRVDHAQGNYRTYSPAEQKLRQIIPFYGWDRHIIQSTYRLLAERPGTVNLGVNLGRQGEAKTQKELGALPTYLQGVVRLGGLPSVMGALGKGRTPVISTKAIGPFAADADILRTLTSAIHGRAGTSSEEASNINPLIEAFIEQMTGRNLVTGSTMKDKLPFGFANVPIRAALNVPQARLLEQVAGVHPIPESKHPTASQDWRSQLASLLGVPIKQVDLNAAHRIAAKQGKPPR